ncbi:MAG: hypothetical protein BWY74_00583 [Firmicutes bacterium ADurb.Bin419]|nr:MAG: hypothetical protein BWY74_00583 [Firmicutes bacterium ADurb.Bin419]
MFLSKTSSTSLLSGRYVLPSIISAGTSSSFSSLLSSMLLCPGISTAIFPFNDMVTVEVAPSQPTSALRLSEINLTGTSVLPFFTMGTILGLSLSIFVFSELTYEFELPM